MRYLVILTTALTLVSCSLDPNVQKQKYLESGKKYYDAGRMKEASIMFRKAIEKDRKFGEAYYRYALVILKQGQLASAIGSLRIASAELKPGADKDDSDLKLSEILILAAQQTGDKNQVFLDELKPLVQGLLKRNPASWQGHKLLGDSALLEAATQMKANNVADGKASIARGAQEYRIALNAKPGDPLLSLALARTLVLEGEMAEAESLFKGMIAKDKKDLKPYVELFRIYYAQKKMPEAEATLKNAIDVEKNNVELRLMLANFYFATDKKSDLIALMNGMKSDLKLFPNAYLLSGDFYARVNQPDEAIRQFEEGISKDSSQRATYLKHEIEVYVRQNKLPQALAANDLILKTDPKDPEARGLRATFMLEKNQITEALADLQSVATARPKNHVIKFNLGRAYFVRGEYELARQEFENCIGLRPDYEPARLALTQVALTTGDFNGAVHNADELLKIHPESVQAKIMKAAGLQRLQKYDEARVLLQGVLDKTPNQVESLLEIGVLDLNQKKNKEAYEHFKKAYAISPDNIRGLMGMSKSLLLDGHPDQSVDLMKQEAAKKSTNADMQRELGNAQLSARQFDNAVSTFSALLMKTTDARQQGDLYNRIGEAYRYKSDYAKSIEAMEKAHKLLPNAASITTNLALLYEAQGKTAEALKYYDLAIKTDSNNPLALNNLAFLLAETNGDMQRAETLATQAKQKLPNFWEVSDTLGWIYYKRGVVDSAIEEFRTLITRVPQNPIYHYHYAMALKQKGDIENAKKECQAALANRPSKQYEDSIRQLMSKL